LTLTHASTNQSVIKTTQLREIKDNDINYSYSLVIPIETDITGYPVSENVIPISTNSVIYNRFAKIENTEISLNDSIQLSNQDMGSVENFLISMNGDTDNDGLPDAWEEQIIDHNGSDSLFLITHVLPEDDFDGDGISNYDEYINNTSPTGTENISPGDLNGDGHISLADAVICLEILSHRTQTILIENDIDKDGSIGIENIIYILKHIAGLR